MLAWVAVAASISDCGEEKTERGEVREGKGEGGKGRGMPKKTYLDAREVTNELIAIHDGDETSKMK